MPVFGAETPYYKGRHQNSQQLDDKDMLGSFGPVNVDILVLYTILHNLLFLDI